MIAVDANLLVYAHRKEVREHQLAQAVMRTLAEGDRPWAIPWPCFYEFFSVVTNHRIWHNHATTPELAWRQLEAWTASPMHRPIGEAEHFMEVLQGFLLRSRVRGAIVHDARVAAICVAHGVDFLYSRDRDFSLFPELRTRDPLRTG